MASTDKNRRLNVRLTDSQYDMIDRVATHDGLTKSEYVLQAIDFYEEHRYLNKQGFTDHLGAIAELNRRNDEIRQWLNKLEITDSDFYLDALNFYLDAMILSNGQPNTMSMVTLNTLLRTISAQLDAVETKTDTLTNLAVDGFSSFSRISSGASYLIDKRDSGALPESRVEGRMSKLNG